MFKIFVLALIGIAVTNGAVWSSMKSINDTFTDFCFYEKYNLTIPLGQKAQNPDYCEEISCTDSGFLEGTSCIPIGIGYDESRCSPVAGDPSKPYPECCPSTKCNET